MSSWSRGGSGASSLPLCAAISPPPLIIDTHRFSGSDSKELAYQCRTLGFDPWVRKIPWRREWQPTPAFSPGESHGQRSLAGYSSCGHKELDTTERLFSFPQFHKGRFRLLMILRAYCFIPLPALLVHLSLALSMCQPQNVALNSFFFSSS